MTDNNQDKQRIGLGQESMAIDSQPTPMPDNTGKVKPKNNSKNDRSSYQAQANTQQNLQRSVESVLVKKYSDYEITIETKDNYEDALFLDEASLDQALDKAGKTATEVITPLSSSRDNTPDTHTKIEDDIDFSIFISSSNPVSDNYATGGTVVIAEQGLNHSTVDRHIESNNDLLRNTLTDNSLQDIGTEQKATADKSSSPEDSEGKSFAQKLAKKAKQKLMQSKAGLDEYTGRSLPEREIQLEFSFPPQKSKKHFESVVTAYDVKKLLEDKGKSIHSIIKQADNDLAIISKCQLSISNRLNLLDTYAEPLFSKCHEIIAMFERKPSAPGDSKRLQLASSCHNCLKYIISGYKQIYKSIYEAANVLYGPQRKTANRVAFRIFDLLLVEQQLTTALHSPLIAGSSKTINKLFTALSLYEPNLINKPSMSFTLKENSSVKALYLRYQVGLAIDTMTLSSSLHRVFKPYIASKLKLLTLLPLNAPSPSTPVWVNSHQRGNKPRYHIAGANISPTEAPAIIIEVAPFFNSIKNDYAECIDLFSHPAKHSSAVLANIKPPYSITLLCELNRQLAQIEGEKTNANYSLYQPIALKAYSGIENCANYFAYQYALKTRKNFKKGEPTSELPAKPPSSKSPWFCAMEDEDKFYLQVTEDTIGITIDIGQLLLLTKTIKPEEVKNDQLIPAEEQPILTRISRMERQPQGKLTIIADIISTTTTHATLTIDSKSTAHCLLAIRKDKRLIITAVQHAPWMTAGHNIEINLPDTLTATVLPSTLENITQTVQIFSLH